MLDDLAIGEAVTAIALGIDRLERSTPKDETPAGGEGLVPIYLGAGVVGPRPYAGWDQPLADLDGLASDMDALAAGPRKLFLIQMLRSLRAVVRLFSGEALGYAEKVREIVGVEPGPVEDERIAELTDALDRALVRAGFGQGLLDRRVERWEAERAVPTEALAGVFAGLMAQAKARTDAAIFDTGDYDMALNPVRGAWFTARCGFEDRRVDLNVDNAFTRAALKHLVCHEVFPGHATQLLSTRKAVEEGRAPADALLCTADAVTGCVQEGIGDQGVQLIDWLEDEDDMIHLLLRTLKSAVQTTAAWRLMEERRPAAEVADYLREAAFGQEAWIEGRLRMAAHPFRGPFIASYYAGNEAVRRVRERVADADKPAFHAYLYDRVHSPDSLAMFTPMQAAA